MTNSQKLATIDKMIDNFVHAKDDICDFFDKLQSIIQVPPTRTKKTVDGFLEEGPEYQLSVLLFSLIRERKPNWKRPDLQKWAYYMDALIRIEKRDPKRIAMVIRWCQQDAFWQSNILSTDKLRKQFDRLEDTMSKDIAFVNKQKLTQRADRVKQGPTMRDLLKEQHG